MVPVEQAACGACERPIFLGDRLCPAGHELRESEGVFIAQVGANPKARTKKWNCPQCGNWAVSSSVLKCGNCGHRSTLLAPEQEPTTEVDLDDQVLEDHPHLSDRTRIGLLKRLGELRSAEVLTDEEFEEEKRRILGIRPDQLGG